jgi:drug/metabolite transporter (DMT)-like permease
VRARLADEGVLVGIVVLWSSGFTVTKYALSHGFSPLAFSAPRYLLGAVILVGLTLAREREFSIQRADLPLFAIAGVIGICLNQLAFTYAVKLTAAATVALVFGTMPVLTALISQLSRAERLTPRHWCATGVSLAGVGLIAAGEGHALSAGLAGITLALCAALTFGLYSVLVGPLTRRHTPLKVAATVTIIGSVPLTISASGQLKNEHWSQIPPLAWGAFLFTVCMFTLTLVLWFRAIERVGAAHATLYSNLQPFLGALFALILLSEPLHSLQVLGAFVLVASIALAPRRTAQPTRPIEQAEIAPARSPSR